MTETGYQRLSRYAIGLGLLVHLLSLYFHQVSYSRLLYGLSFLSLSTGFYASYRWRGYHPLKKGGFYATVVVLVFPVLGPLVAIQKLYVTPRCGEKVSAKRKRIATWTSICVLAGGIILYLMYWYGATKDYRVRHQIREHRETAWNHFNLALHAEREGDEKTFRAETEKAISEFNKALSVKTDPSRKTDIFRLLGDIYYVREDPVLAEKNYMEALRINPEDTYVKEKLKEMKGLRK